MVILQKSPWYVQPVQLGGSKQLAITIIRSRVYLLKHQMEIHVRRTVTVHRVHAMVTVVVPKDNLPDALHVIRMVIAVHVMQDIIDHLMSVFNAAVVKPVFRDRHRLRIVQLRLRNQMEQYVR